MFNFYGKGRCIKTVYEGENHEVVLFEDVEGSKVVVHIQKDFDKYDLMKSGEWIMAKLRANARSKINRKGDIFFNTMVTPDKVRELLEDEQRNLRQEIIDNVKEVEKIKKAKKEKKAKLIEIAEILVEDEKENVEADMKGECTNV